MNAESSTDTHGTFKTCRHKDSEESFDYDIMGYTLKMEHTRNDNDREVINVYIPMDLVERYGTYSVENWYQNYMRSHLSKRYTTALYGKYGDKKTDSIIVAYEVVKDENYDTGYCKGCKLHTTEKESYQGSCTDYVCTKCENHYGDREGKYLHKYCSICDWNKQNFDPLYAGETWEEDY
jgi:hypothetical protein